MTRCAQRVLEAHELVALALDQPRHGDAGPARNHLGDVLGVDLFLEHALVGLQLGEPLRRRRQLLLQAGMRP